MKAHRLFIFTLLSIFFGQIYASIGPVSHGFVLADNNREVSVYICTDYEPVVEIAMQMYDADMKDVTGKRVSIRKNATIRLYQLNRMTTRALEQLRKKGIPVNQVERTMDAFCIKIIDRKVYVVGNNGRGVAYGLLELSRMAGVSPWKWWGDVVPEKRERLVLPPAFETVQAPSVAYRGIFLNDED